MGGDGTYQCAGCGVIDPIAGLLLCEMCNDMRPPTLDDQAIRSAERARVVAGIVAWLRTARIPIPPPPGWSIADAIERGEWEE